MRVYFKFFGNQMEAEVESFAEYMSMLCEFVQNKGENWKQFCEKNIEIIAIKEV